MLGVGFGLLEGAGRLERAFGGAGGRQIGGDGVLGVLDETDGRALGGCSVGHVSGECEDGFNGRFGDFVASHGAELSKIRPGAQAENAETSGYFLSE